MHGNENSHSFGRNWLWNMLENRKRKRKHGWWLLFVSKNRVKKFNAAAQEKLIVLLTAKKYSYNNNSRNIFVVWLSFWVDFVAFSDKSLTHSRNSVGKSWNFWLNEKGIVLGWKWKVSWKEKNSPGQIRWQLTCCRNYKTVDIHARDTVYIVLDSHWMCYVFKIISYDSV